MLLSDEVYEGDLAEFFAKVSERDRENNEYGHPEMVVMQAIGIRDRKGKEIFEGDLVDVYYKDFSKDKVYPKETTSIAWNQENAGFNIPPVEDGEYEVIGNVWENQDLIK